MPLQKLIPVRKLIYHSKPYFTPILSVLKNTTEILRIFAFLTDQVQV
jgi:hypothetical protein